MGRQLLNKLSISLIQFNPFFQILMCFYLVFYLRFYLQENSGLKDENSTLTQENQKLRLELTNRSPRRYVVCTWDDPLC